MILFRNVSLSRGKSTTRHGGSAFFRRKVTIFIGRETKTHILPTKINEKKIAKVSPSNIFILLQLLTIQQHSSDLARVYSFVVKHISKTLTIGLLMAAEEGAPASLVAATRADDRAHGVGRSPAPLFVPRCRARDARRSTEPEDGQLQGGSGVLRVV